MELLDEIWSFIFREHLDLAEAARCRRVSKRFKSLIDQMRPTELLVYYEPPSSHADTDHRDDRNPLNWIQLYRFKLKPNSSFHILFANLRVLQLNMTLGETFKDEEFHLELLNEFVLLEELYLNKVIICRNQTLQLPKLQVLSIDLYSEAEYRQPWWQEMIDNSQQPRLVLDSKVRRLFCERTTLLIIKNPDCVEFLQCSHSNLERNQPTRFQNLRVLRVLDWEPSGPTLITLESLLIGRLKSLEEIYLEPIWEENDEVIRLDESVQRLALGREVKIYVFGVCLPSDGSLETSIDALGREPMEFRIRNYHRLADRVRSEKLVWYEELVDWLDSLLPDRVELDEWRFPVGFFRKFTNIRTVWVQRVEDEERFLNFLSRCTRLTELRIGREQLTQSLLDRLPAVCGQLKVFAIRYASSPSSGLDLRPIYRLNQLFVLEVGSRDAHLDGSLDLLVLFESCRYLMKVGLKQIRIEKQKKLYHVLIPCEADLNCLRERASFNYGELMKNLATIIEECKELRKRTSPHFNWLLEEWHPSYPKWKFDQ